jgi:hypothetical protein
VTGVRRASAIVYFARTGNPLVPVCYVTKTGESARLSFRTTRVFSIALGVLALACVALPFLALIYCVRKGESLTATLLVTTLFGLISVGLLKFGLTIRKGILLREKPWIHEMERAIRHAVSLGGA